MNQLINNLVSYLSQAIKNAGGPAVTSAEEVLNNLYYLSKEDGRGSRYLPLQYKRMIEKLVCGFFNSSLEYEDGKDVYFEKVGDTTVCVANVYWVQHDEAGNKCVLGHGFNCLSLTQVLPGTFMSDAERAASWKSVTIGGAKSRALYDGGIGLEFYGDIFAPEVNLDENDKPEIPTATPISSSPEPIKAVVKGKEITLSESGLPVPQPKKKKKEEKPKEEAPAPVVEEAVTEPKLETPALTLEVAKTLVADIGNCKGMPLGEILEKAPRNLVFLVRNAESAEIREGARLLVLSDEELSTRFTV